MKGFRKRRKELTKFTSLFLSLILLCNFIVPTTVTAQSADTAVEDEYTSEVASVIKEAKDPEQLERELDELTYEIVSWREENVKHFRFADGTYSAVVFGEAVHRLNADGEWVDIDNSLTELGGAISTGDARVKFEKKITGSETLFTLHENNYKITFGLDDAIKKTEATVIETDAETEYETKLQRLTSLENLSSSIVYEDILDGVDLEYVIVSNSIKENIIVKEASDAYSYTFTLGLNGLDASLVGGAVVISDKDSGETVYTIPAPFMYDASGELSYAAEYTLTESSGNGKYELTLTADAEWINEESRAFPVVIDPSLVAVGQTADTYVSSAAPNATGNNADFLIVSDTCEAYFRFDTPNILSGVSITGASVSLPFYFDVQSNGYMTVDLHRITSDWNESTVTWNTRPSRSSAIDSADVLSGAAYESDPQTIAFNVKNTVISWYDEMEPAANYGFAVSRNSGPETEVRFVSRRDMSVPAKLTIDYSGTHMPEGVYAVKNSAANIYWETSRPTTTGYVSKNAGLTSAPLSAEKLQNLFKIAYRPSTNDYVIRSMLDNSLVIYPDANTKTVKTEYRSESDTAMPTTHVWRIIAVGSYYYICYPNPSDGKVYYLTSTSSNGNLALTTSTSDTGIRWTFSQFTGEVYEDVSWGEDSFTSLLYVGDTYYYDDVYMRSTRIGQNGPLSCSMTIASVDNQSVPNIAWFSTSTGKLEAYYPGSVYINVTYPGSPWVWSWLVTISKLPVSGYEIAYNPSLWNNASTVGYSNCYNYALNKRETVNVGVLQPGVEGEVPWSSIVQIGFINYYDVVYPFYLHQFGSKNDLLISLQADSANLGFTFTSIGKNVVCPEGTYKVALVIDLYDDPNIANAFIKTGDEGSEIVVEEPDIDYHWYRQNPDGSWSHKQGGTNITKLDASNNVIYDPQSCDRNYVNDSGVDYSIFVGYYAVTPLG